MTHYYYTILYANTISATTIVLCLASFIFRLMLRNNNNNNNNNNNQVDIAYYSSRRQRLRQLIERPIDLAPSTPPVWYTIDHRMHSITLVCTIKL